LPAASRLRNSTQETSFKKKFSEFKRSVYKPFILEIATEIESRIKVDPVSAAFACLDVRYFPKLKSDLLLHGKTDIQILINHFGEPEEASHPKTLRNNRADPKIDKLEILEEFEIFKTTVFDLNSQHTSELKLKIYMLKQKLKTTLKTKSNQADIKKLNLEILSLESKINKMTLSEVYDLLAVPGKAFLFPNILKLLEMAIISPIGNATVERLFSFLKLVKTKLRNSLGDGTLDKLLRIKLECKEELEDSDLEELVDRFKEYLTELSKSGVIKINI
jgi:hypothetical protein